MATSVPMASSHDHNAIHILSEDHPHLPPPPPPDHLLTKTAKPSSISTPRRKLTRGNDKKKKPPQRGMGVDKLERLRLKKLSELNCNNNNNTPSSSFPYAVIPSSFPNDPPSFVPLHLGKYGAFAGGSTDTVGGVGGFNLNQQPPPVLVPRVGLFLGQGMASDDNSQGNLYGVGNGSEASKELSSTPNMINSYFDRCSVCHQKKLNFVGQNLVYKGHKDMNASSCKTSSGFAGFNVGNSHNHKGRTALVFGKNFNFQAAATYSVSNIDQGIVDTATVHRKGSSSGGGSAGNFFMEYEFFPAASGKGSKIDSHDQSENELMMTMKKTVDGSEDPSSVYEVMAGGDGNTSCVPTTVTCGGAGIAAASSSIDLSLRLSY